MSSEHLVAARAKRSTHKKMRNSLIACCLLLLTAPADAVSAPPDRVRTDVSDRVGGLERSSVLVISEAVPDSSELRSRARNAQARFERTRVRYAPRNLGGWGGDCDERVGRMCLRLGDGSSDDWEPPEEDPRVDEARSTLLEILEGVAREIPGDTWVLGQRVAYLGEAERWQDALGLVRECTLAPDDRWWCTALEGMALHYLDRFPEAEEAFQRAMAEMPSELEETWRDLRPLAEFPVRDVLGNVEGDSLRTLESRIWALANPLFLVPGNDHRTEHFARHTLARTRADARNAHGMRWGDDLTEVLVRYGPVVAYEQQRPPPFQFQMGPPSVIARFHPRSRGFLPPRGEFLEGGEITPGEWRTDARRVRARHAPSYADRIGLLEVQQARFRRGDDLLLVLGWTVGDGDPTWQWPEGEVSGDGVDRPGDEAEIRSGLFLLSHDDLEPVEARSDVRGPFAQGPDPAGVALARAPSGTYMVSLELLDVAGERAWRARHGVVQDPVSRDVVTLSDLLLLRPEATAGEGEVVGEGDSLEAHVDRVLPSVRLQREPVEVAWEVYGLSDEEDVLRFSLVARPEDRGLMRRAGEFLRLVDPEASVEISWEEGVNTDGAMSPDDALLRRVVMDLSSLSTGSVRLTLNLSLPGRTAAVTERVVELADGP